MILPIRRANSRLLPRCNENYVVIFILEITLASPNSVYVRLKAGVYSVILREYDARKPDRMESNILHVKIHDNEQITIRASLLDGQLILFYDDIA
jgi:hypothetical protein